ncbi:hypothetical protein SAMN05444364_10685 [Prevotella scopos JCM 17725]|uniref:Uncharacterized protein n=1 Tax=Prevotella scopos JCM 17725 TaxID=1236518 RepID=A0AAX2F2N2_9BACT|nr:hypothetical protein SAMN05444364_10685 [Prevotella scopos JCM 17725]
MQLNTRLKEHTSNYKPDFIAPHNSSDSDTKADLKVGTIRLSNKKEDASEQFQSTLLLFYSKVKFTAYRKPPASISCPMRQQPPWC